MRQVTEKLLQMLLKIEPKQIREEVLLDMVKYSNSNPNLLNTVIIGDEPSVFGYDP